VKLRFILQELAVEALAISKEKRARQVFETLESTNE
jgi:hypothetical protein